MKRLLIFLFAFEALALTGFAQEESILLSAGQFQTHQRIFLAPLDGWHFKQGHDPNWANPDIDLSAWERMNPTALNPNMEDENGPGIPASIKDKIFQPFFTTKPTGQGTGLGLSLSYDIMKAHGGSLQVETEEEKGSIFTIQIPV